MPSGLLICARALHFGSGMILVGIMAFRWLVLLPGFAGETDQTWKKFTPFFLWLQRLVIGSGILLLVSGVALFAAVTAEMSGATLTESLTGDAARTALLDTQFGHVSQWRLGLALVWGGIMLSAARNPWPAQRKVSWLEITTGLLALALVVSLAWTGHASAAGGPDLKWRLAADVLHLLAASIWPAGLLPFALFLGHARRVLDFIPHGPVLAVAQRFSRVSFLTVGVLVTTGFVNACYSVGSFPLLISTDYGRLLCLKLALFAGILCFATWNRYRLVPQLLSRSGLPEQGPLPLLGRLRSFVLIEFGLAVAIVVVVSFLGITPPSR